VDVSSIQNTKDKDVRSAQLNELAERNVLDLLNVMRDLEVVKFDEYSNRENDQFKKEFARTILQLTNMMEKLS